jgi:hypothetical protein
MGLIDRLRALIGPMADVSELARAARVAALVPPTSEYVTIGQFAVLPDARAFVGGVPGRQPYRHDVGLVPHRREEAREVGLLVLAEHRLRVMTATGERWSVPVDQITDLDGHRHSGFVVITRGGPGIVLSTPSPVQVPPGVAWRTVGGVTNAFGGWDRVLAPYGTQVHW